MLFDIGEKEFKLAGKYDYDFTLMILDIDKFKRINDTYGHHIGDEVLIEFSDRIKNQIRKEDIFARHGGEEFAIIIRKTNERSGLQISEKIRESIAKFPFNIEDNATTVTVSIGFTQFSCGYSDFDGLMKAADSALYEAKETGRNKVIYRK